MHTSLTPKLRLKKSVLMICVTEIIEFPPSHREREQTYLKRPQTGRKRFPALPVPTGPSSPRPEPPSRTQAASSRFDESENSSTSRPVWSSLRSSLSEKLRSGGVGGRGSSNTEATTPTNQGRAWFPTANHCVRRVCGGPGFSFTGEPIAPEIHKA